MHDPTMLHFWSKNLFVKLYCEVNFHSVIAEEMDSDDALLIKLRNEMPEQFASLVKMHLSFCLDQSTDE